MAYPIPDYNKLYIGAYHVDYAMVNNKLIKKIYRGHTDGLEMIYRFGFPPITYYPKSTLQTFTVPNGLTQIRIDCVGSKGTGTNFVPGKGGRVECDLTVVGGQTIYIMVGDIPTVVGQASYNASDIRIGGTDLSNRVVVAGGGGSSTNTYSCSAANGGDGGGEIGKNGTGHAPGKGGTQSAGGAGGHNTTAGNWAFDGTPGSFGLGGSNSRNTAGAGGAGWYGGGGGCEFCATHYYLFVAGGGGGSSYVDPNLCSQIPGLDHIHTQGYNDGPGYVTISMPD